MVADQRASSMAVAAANGNRTDVVRDAAPAESSSCWTPHQDQQLQHGLQMYPSSLEKNTRWSRIAQEVTGKSKKECVARFKGIRTALKAKLSANNNEDEPEEEQKKSPAALQFKNRPHDVTEGIEASLPSIPSSHNTHGADTDQDENEKKTPTTATATSTSTSNSSSASTPPPPKSSSSSKIKMKKENKQQQPQVLIPSQALQSSSDSTSNKSKTNTNTNANTTSRRTRRNNTGTVTDTGTGNRSSPSPNRRNNKSNHTIDNDPEAAGNEVPQSKNPRRRRQKKKQQQQKEAGGTKEHGTTNNANNTADHTPTAAQQKPPPPPPKPKKKRNNKTRKKNKTKYPWRKDIPPGSVDPITLEELASLDYPPFALVADEPYIPIPTWPVPRPNVAAAAGPGADAADHNETPKKQNNKNNHVDVEDLNRQRLAQQWGMEVLGASHPPKSDGTACAPLVATQTTKTFVPLSERPVNLFDGRALAFYLVSQLQFIDPFTRRDLTRPELVNLDRYLLATTPPTHNAHERPIRVTEAYDAKGITLSSAGAAASTAQGRADIMQQLAQQLLNSLFVNQSVTNGGAPPTVPTTTAPTAVAERSTESFSLQEQYAAIQRQELQQQQQQQQRGEQQQQEQQAAHGYGDSAGVYYNDGSMGGGGFTIIDDDENPELRGRNDFPSLITNAAAGAGPVPAGNFSSHTSSSPFYSAAHIAGAGRYRPGTIGSASSDDTAFPSLQSTAAASSSTNNSRHNNDTSSAARTAVVVDVTRATSSVTKPKKKSKTLSKISGIVKKTTNEEKQKQWEAREAARRKAMMSNLTFGSNHASSNNNNTSNSSSLLTPPSLTLNDGSIIGEGDVATKEQVERNRAFAEALGVRKRSYASGWARPTTEEDDGTGTGTVENNNDDNDDDHFRRELVATTYPESLVVQASDQIPLLMKLEKKWKLFLKDDKTASLPLTPMDKPNRAFVHQYAELWNLKTESFDPQPKRYVHCVKLLQTRMPRPLLSDVVTQWRNNGRRLTLPAPLPDATRTLFDSLPDATRTVLSPSSTPAADDHTSQQTAGQTSKSRELPPSTAIIPQNSRLNALMGDSITNIEQRPMLDILPRSVPLNQEQQQLQEQAAVAASTCSTYAAEEDLKKRQMRLEERKRKEKQKQDRKKQVLEDAFASDDDEDDDNNKKRNISNDDEWGEQTVALYDGSDDE